MRFFVWSLMLVVAVILLSAPAVLATNGEGTTEVTDETDEHGPKVTNVTDAAVYRTVGLAAAAAFTTAVSILGAGYAVGRIGSAALGAAAEHPDLLTRSILLVALAEGLAVLGFAVAMMIVFKIQ
jgi:V/A-type H+-transporting ATPase subunit K